MFKKLFFIIFLLIGFLFSEGFAIEPYFMKDPAISPDGETVCFSYMSDLWIVPFKGGEAKRITVSKGEDSGPVFSPDGKWIAFNSNRDGQKNIYIIPSEGGEAQCISKEGLQVCDWFNNGKKLLASGYEVDLGANLFSVRLLADEKRPTEITAIGDFYSKLSPDNKKIIFNRGGMAYREAYHGSINGELWEYNIDKKKYTRLTNTDYTERYPVYSYVNDRIYFAATKGRIFQLYYAVPTGRDDLENRIQISNLDIWSVRDIDIARENDRIVFERFDEIWKYNPQNNEVDKLDIEIKQDYIENFEVDEEVSNSANEFAISPDGKLIAFCYKYDLFAVPEKEDEVKQITFDQMGITDIVIMPDNHTIFFTRYEKEQTELYKVNIKDIDNIEKIKWFSNGKFVEDIKSGYEDYLLVYYSDEVSKNKLASLNSKTGKVEKIISDQVLSPDNCAWSKEGRYLLYVTVEEGSWDNNLYIYDFETKEKRLIIPYHGWISAPYWGMKGDFAFYTGAGKIYKIELQAKEDFWDEEDNWKPILAEENKKTIKKDKEEKGKEEEKEEEKEEVKPIKIDFKDIDKRIYELVSKEGNNWIVATITDSMIYYLNSYDRKYTLRKVDYKGKKDEEFYKFSAEIEYLTYNETNKCFYYVENNSIKKLSMDKKSEIIKFGFKYKYNRLALNKTVFEQAWTIFGRNFYDPNMHGQDWKALYKRFHPYMDYAYTPQIMNDIISEMIGELDASHTGFYPRDEGGVHQYEQAFGGFILDYFDIPNKGIRFKKIFRKSKLNMPYGIKPGDILLSVDGIEITPKTSVPLLFINKVGDKIKLEIQTSKGSASGGEDSVKTIEIKGISWWGNKTLYYDNWVDERKEIVDTLTNGKVGYAYIRSMGHSSYVKFVQDIFARNQDKDALIIDVRNNPGGWIHDLLVELLTKKSYAYTTNRLFNAKKQTFPSDTWEKPLILLINEHSFSDAEIFPILFKQLKLGKIVGMPTCGAVIGTGHVYFMDGSSMRMPGTGWFTAENINMEGMGAQPDILIDQTPEQKIADDDVQLKKAVEEILKKVEGK